MPRFSPSEFFGPSRCLFPTPGLTSKYPICVVCVCVRVYTHVHPYTLPPVLRIEKTTDNTPIFPCVKNNPTVPRNKRSHRLVEPPHPHSPMLNETNCTYMRYRERHIYLYTHIHIYIYTPTHTHTLTHIYTFIHIRVYTYIHTYIYIYIYKCIHIHIYTHMYIYMYIYSAYAHPVASVKQMCTLMFTTSV